MVYRLRQGVVDLKPVTLSSASGCKGQLIIPRPTLDVAKQANRVNYLSHRCVGALFSGAVNT